MSVPAHTPDKTKGHEEFSRARVGVPYRTLNEQLTKKRDSYDKYLASIREAGGEPVEVSLTLSPREFEELARTLDAIVLPGGPADVEPNRYRASRHDLSAAPDPEREKTDLALLKHAFEEHKPVLGICYGVQILNVFLGGTLIQDIASETHTSIQHQWKDRASGAPEPHHMARVEPGSRLAQLGDAPETEINSSHHQAILEPARGLRVTARAPDGIIEGVEWTGESDWVTGVQWHPERMKSHETSNALFRQLIAVTRVAHVRS
ncbi:MAG: gamma-glutamyl-gamma-aminobutyrate hydrolase family protein [Candidatus Acidiferrales bacterium]